MVNFGQFVVGAPGSGKTSYCKAMQDLLTNLGRKVDIINLDPANEEFPYKAAVCISELVKVEDVMDTQKIGPNGAMLYCMELLEKNIDWLLAKLQKLSNSYLIFDLPGQAELYTHHSMVKNILNSIQKADIRLCSVFMVDSHYSNDPGKYVAALLLTLNSMVQLEMPTVNVLSKIDSVERYGSLEFGLDFYTEVLDLQYLVEELNQGPLTKRYYKLNSAIADLISDYSLVSYIPVSICKRSTLINVMKAVDKANGYVYGTGEERNILSLLSSAVGADFDHDRLGVDRDEFAEEESEQETIKLIAERMQS